MGGVGAIYRVTNTELVYIEDVRVFDPIVLWMDDRRPESKRLTTEPMSRPWRSSSRGASRLGTDEQIADT